MMVLRLISPKGLQDFFQVIESRRDALMQRQFPSGRMKMLIEPGIQGFEPGARICGE
jgi:hypothetical protein